MTDVQANFYSLWVLPWLWTIAISSLHMEIGWIKKWCAASVIYLFPLEQCCNQLSTVINQLSTNHQPTNNQPSNNYQPTISQLSTWYQLPTNYQHLILHFAMIIHPWLNYTMNITARITDSWHRYGSGANIYNIDQNFLSGFSHLPTTNTDTGTQMTGTLQLLSLNCCALICGWQCTGLTYQHKITDRVVNDLPRSGITINCQ